MMSEMTATTIRWEVGVETETVSLTTDIEQRLLSLLVVVPRFC